MAPYLIVDFPSSGGTGGIKQKAFADCTWEEVKAICDANLASTYWSIGDEKPMTLGTSVKTLRIIGFSHDVVTDQETYGKTHAAITLEMIDPQDTLKGVMNSTTYTDTAWYHTSSNYHCNFRKTLLPKFLSNEMPHDLTSILVPVNKEFRNSGGTKQTISDTLFLLSTNEITGTYTSGNGSEGTQYAYFKAGNSPAHGVSYWTRSCIAGQARFQYINSTGGVSTTFVNTDTLYGFPCMCI